MERPLIDFSSPDSPAKRCLDPLIPSHSSKPSKEKSSFVSTVGAPESNPFDMVANEIAAHSAAEGDPFEMAFQAALNGNKNDCNVVVISPNMHSKTGSDVSWRDDGLRVRKEIAMKMDSMGKEVVSEAKHCDLSECKGVSGNIRRGLLDRLSILNLEDILPPDLLDSSFGGSPKLFPDDEAVGCIEILKSNPLSLSSSKCFEEVAMNNSVYQPIPPLNFTFDSVLNDKKLSSDPPSTRGTPNASLNVSESPFGSPLLHTIKSDKELQAMVTKRIEKIIQAAQNQLSQKSQVLKSPYVSQESTNGVEQYFTKLKNAGNVESALSIPRINDSQSLMDEQSTLVNSNFLAGDTSTNVTSESPVFDEPVCAKEANVLSNIFSASAHNLLDIKDDGSDLLMCEQPPDWTSLHLPELSDDEIELIEKAAEKRTQKVSEEKVKSVSPPAQSKVPASARRRSKSVDCQSRALPTSSPPTLPPLPLCEEAIRSLTLSSKFLLPLPCPEVQKTKRPSAINLPLPMKDCKRQKSLPVEPVTAQTRFLLRKKADGQTTNRSQRGPLKATLPVKSMTRTEGSPHVAKGSLKIGPAMKNVLPRPSIKVVPTSPLLKDLHGYASPADVPMSSSVHAHKPAANILCTRSSGKSLIPSCSPVPRGHVRPPIISRGNSPSYLGPPQSSLAAHNRDKHTLKQSPSRSLHPAMSHSRSAEPTEEIHQKKTRNASPRKSPLIVHKMGTSAKPKTPLLKCSSNPRVLTDVNTLQAGGATPIRKRSLVPSPRPVRRTHMMEKENVHS